jgi:hypothetical protein
MNRDASEVDESRNKNHAANSYDADHESGEQTEHAEGDRCPGRHGRRIGAPTAACGQNCGKLGRAG